MAMGKKIVLVSCVSKKDDKPRSAENLYLSQWFKKASAYAKLICDEWYILSAKFGLLSPNAIIPPYDVTLNNMKSANRKLWAQNVFEQLKTIINPGDEIIFLAGTKYRENLISPLEKVGIQISIPMEGLRIGEQMSWLNKKIQYE